MNDHIDVVFVHNPGDEQEVTAMEQFDHYIEVPENRTFSSMFVSVTTPNGTVAECVLESFQDDMTGYYEMCEELVTTLFASRDAYAGLLRFRNTIYGR